MSQVLNAATIDVEDWYPCLDPDLGNWSGYEDRIVDSTRQILRILKDADTHATFFVLGDVAEHHPDLVREIHAAGHEVGSHGCTHRFIYDQTPEEFEADVAKSLRLLESITGEPVISYRGPYFSITRKSLWALPILKSLGIKYDSSIFPVVNPRYGIPDAPRTPFMTSEGVIEVPISTFPVRNSNLPVGGGVYFRVFPYSLLHNCFRRLNRNGEQVVFYLHPWECDPGHPRIPVSLGLKMRHYWALDKTAGKLSRLLADFKFGPIREVVRLDSGENALRLPGEVTEYPKMANADRQSFAE